MQLIISAFPGYGKSSLFRKAFDYDLIPCQVAKNEDGVPVITTPPAPAGSTYLFDSDSSLFDKTYFPHNYIDHIKGILESYTNVVILVSSHQEVRNALSANGMEYILVYPDRSLKAEFIQRYIDRGSPETFVKMMEDKWDVFIDSCINPLSSHNSAGDYVLKSGEGLADVYVREMEHIGELKRKLKEEFSKPKGSHFNDALSKAYGNTFSDLKELDVNLKQDIAILKEQIDKHQEAEIHGNESFSMNKRRMSAFKTYAKQVYGIDIEDNISGMESFMEKLRETIKKARGFLKGQPDKQSQLQIKRYITDCDKAIKLYGSASWLSNQTFRDVAEITISTVPAGLGEVRNVSELARIITPFISNVENSSKTMEREARARLAVGLNIWNRFKNATGDADDVAKQLQRVLDGVKLQPEKGYDKDKLIGVFVGESSKGVRIPPLDASGVKEVVKIITALYEQWFAICNRSLDVAEDALSWDDVYDNDLFGEMVEHDKQAVNTLIKLVEWETLINPMTNLEADFEKVIVPVAQMLENWILYSVE